ncbi:MAG: energy-coupling factor transporter transmembrane protein EcfT [Lachnospiraceae bacterium]|nr:energy-coupling factor transporter transmembrane protein EcfT [Lachnospiraceae bacterium]
MQQFREFHPIVNLIFILEVLILTMSAINPYSAGISLIVAITYGVYLYGVRFIKIFVVLAIPVIIFAGIIVPLFSHNGETALFYINDLPVTLETMIFGLVTGMVMMATIAWFYVAGSMIDTEKFLYLTGRIFPTISLIISMTIGMIPVLIRRYKEVSDAQAGLGRISSKMSLPKRIGFIIKKMSIVITWSLENSVSTTISMESRGYGTGKRTNAHLYKFVGSDRIMLAVLLLLGGIPCVRALMGKFRVNYFPAIELTKLKAVNIISLVLIIMIMFVPMICDMANRIYEKNERRKNIGR